MLYLVALSGIVRILAISKGTPTSLICIKGSGLITLLAEKFVLFPAKLCLICPSLPFILSLIVFNFCPLLCLAGGN